MNKATALAIGAALALSVTLAACAGFDIGDVVQVRTPAEVQQTTGLPRKQTLNEAESSYEAWVEDVTRQSAQWRESIERGNEVAMILTQISMRALDEVGPTIAGLPVLGPALPFLTLLTGLVIRRPGDVSRREAEKEKRSSYNRGIDVGRGSTAT